VDAYEQQKGPEAGDCAETIQSPVKFLASFLLKTFIKPEGFG
jgi:hypothetical protein